jgi:hypothetical protein
MTEKNYDNFAQLASLARAGHAPHFAAVTPQRHGKISLANADVAEFFCGSVLPPSEPAGSAHRNIVCAAARASMRRQIPDRHNISTSVERPTCAVSWSTCSTFFFSLPMSFS